MKPYCITRPSATQYSVLHTGGSWHTVTRFVLVVESCNTVSFRAIVDEIVLATITQFKDELNVSYVLLDSLCTNLIMSFVIITHILQNTHTPHVIACNTKAGR